MLERAGGNLRGRGEGLAVGVSKKPGIFYSELRIASDPTNTTIVRSQVGKESNYNIHGSFAYGIPRKIYLFPIISSI